MMKHTLLAATLIAGSTAFGGTALAQQTAPTQTAPMRMADSGILPISGIVDRLSQQGYRDIREIEFDDGEYEVEAWTAEGRRVELHVDPRNGGILRTERDDD